MRLTKIDVAEAHLVTAVRNTFTGQHPASVYLLAASAREILTQIGHKLGIRTVLHGAAEDTGKKLRRQFEFALSGQLDQMNRRVVSLRRATSTTETAPRPYRMRQCAISIRRYRT